MQTLLDTGRAALEFEVLSALPVRVVLKEKASGLLFYVTGTGFAETDEVGAIGGNVRSILVLSEGQEKLAELVGGVNWPFDGVLSWLTSPGGALPGFMDESGSTISLAEDGAVDLSESGLTKSLTIRGSDGDDLIRGSSDGANAIFHGAGQDTLYGGAKADLFFGQVGEVELHPVNINEPDQVITSKNAQTTVHLSGGPDQSAVSLEFHDHADRVTVVVAAGTGRARVQGAENGYVDFLRGGVTGQDALKPVFAQKSMRPT